MPVLRRVYVDQKEIDAAVERAATALAPDVVRIRYSLGDDWTGDPAIFFRIVLSDDASQGKRLLEAGLRAEATIRDEVDFYEMGLLSYFSFRSLSEQAGVKEKDWE